MASIKLKVVLPDCFFVSKMIPDSGMSGSGRPFFCIRMVPIQAATGFLTSLCCEVAYVYSATAITFGIQHVYASHTDNSR